MKITFLGTNGWYNTQTGNTPCVLLETKKEYLILDAGDGIYKLDQYFKSKKPVYLFLSHFHLDHISGLHILNKFEKITELKKIEVYGPPNLKKIFNTLVNQPISKYYKDIKIKINLNPLDIETSPPFDMEYRQLLHSSQCFGYRFYLENKIISYCTDTGVCDNLYYLTKNADLAILECSFRPGETDPGWPHLNPESAALVAKNSQVRKLALIHFDASRYLNLKDRLKAQKTAKKIFFQTIASYDNLTISL